MEPRNEAEEALAALAAGGLRGDAPQTWELFDRGWPALVAWIGRLIRVGRVPRDLSEDAGQAALLRVWKARMNYRGQTTPELLAWIRTVLRNEVARLAAGRERVPQEIEADRGAALEPSVGDVTASSVEATDERRALADCLEQLPEPEREVVGLLYSESSPTEREAAVVLGRSKTRVNALRTSGLARLATCLRGKGIEA